MKDNYRNKFDSLLEMHKFWWARFDKRNEYHWRFSFSYWSAILLYTGSVFNLDSISILEIPKIPSILFIVLIGFLLFYLYQRFCNDITSRNVIDREKSEIFENKLLQIMQIKYPENLIEKNKNFKTKSKNNYNWSTNIHLAITFIILLIAILTTISKL